MSVRNEGPDRLSDAFACANLSPELIAPLRAYLNELSHWNRAYNLSGIRDPTAMVTRHLLDSLAVLPFAGPLKSEPWRLLDVGSGAGLPGLVLAIARPDWQVTVLDGNGKKARFLRHAVRRLRLVNVEVVEARVEVWQSSPPFDRIISRAFAELGDFVSLSTHLLRDDGRWLAMKGKVTPEELLSLPPGMSIQAIHSLQVPGLAESRNLIEVQRA